MNRIALRALAAAPLVLSAATPAPGQDVVAPRFAPPVLLKAGDKVIGGTRMYPSPAMYDVNGDGRLDVVIGDLPGRLTFALRRPDGTFADEQKLNDAEGAVLDFGNW